MCTMTWIRPRPGELTVCFNRDEQRSRPAAEPPRTHTTGGLHFLAPTDPVGGGTWLAVNECGLVLALLNHYAVDHVWRARQPVSRGRLILGLIDAQEVEEVTWRMTHLRMEDYHPFLLATLDPANRQTLHRWDGHHIEARELMEGDLPLTTSSVDTRHVLAHRQRAFQRARETAHGINLAALERYHAHRDELGGAYSVCMTRPDAQTVSYSQVTITPDGIQFLYQPIADAVAQGPSHVVRLHRL